jgi:hypothetical protein
MFNDEVSTSSMQVTDHATIFLPIHLGFRPQQTWLQNRALASYLLFEFQVLHLKLTSRIVNESSDL